MSKQKERHSQEYDVAALGVKPKAIEKAQQPEDKARLLLQAMMTPSEKPDRDKDDPREYTQSAFEYFKFGGFSKEAVARRMMQSAAKSFKGMFSAKPRSLKEYVANRASQMAKLPYRAVKKLTGTGVVGATGGVLRGAGRLSFGLAKRLGPVGLLLGAVTAPELKARLDASQEEASSGQFQDRGHLRRLLK